MKVLSGLLAMAWGAGALSAQMPSVAEQEAQRARQLLSSSQGVDKAWGVYLSAALRSPVRRGYWFGSGDPCFSA